MGLQFSYMSTFESTVKQIPHPQESVYATLSDLSNLQAVKDGIEQNRDRLPEEALQHMDKLKDLKFDSDSLSIQAPMVGEIRLRIIQREPCKTIKFETENSPIALNMWIQLLPVTVSTCKMKLTVKGDIPFMLKAMVSKPLQEGVEKVADMLAMIPYK